MKATGIVRRIDDLGRVVIPKEIRRTMRIREGDPLEIYTDREGEVILKKYSPIGEMNECAGGLADAASKSLGCVFIVTDTDQIIAVAGAPKKEFMERRISQVVEDVIHSKTGQIFEEPKRLLSITQDGVPTEDYKAHFVVPIVCQGDSIGSIILMSKEARLKDSEKHIADIGAVFLAGQMDN